MDDNPHIVIAGAGAIGCFVGGVLAASGKRVTFLGRPRILSDLRSHGLTLTDYAGLSARIPADQLCICEDPCCLSDADIILVTVKSTATAQIADDIAAYAPVSSRIVSLQNGMGNDRILQSKLPQHDIRAGMVPFNVVPRGDGHFHRASSGDIVIEAGSGGLDAAISAEHLVVRSDDNIKAVQWGKLLVNLMNALNALADQPLRTQLMSRDWRTLMADQMAEAIGVLKAHGIKPVSTTPLPVSFTPLVLRLPTPIFRRVAAKMLTIDPQARASMAFDVMAGRPTEIDAFQGEIIRLADEAGIKAPISSGILKAIKMVGSGGPQTFTPQTLRHAIMNPSTA